MFFLENVRTAGANAEIIQKVEMRKML